MTPLRIAGINAMFSRRNNAELVVPGDVDPCATPLWLEDWTSYADDAAYESAIEGGSALYETGGSFSALATLDGSVQFEGHQTLKVPVGDVAPVSKSIDLGAVDRLWVRYYLRFDASLFGDNPGGPHAGWDAMKLPVRAFSEDADPGSAGQEVTHQIGGGGSGALSSPATQANLNDWTAFAFDVASEDTGVDLARLQSEAWIEMVVYAEPDRVRVWTDVGQGEPIVDLAPSNVTPGTWQRIGIYGFDMSGSQPLGGGANDFAWIGKIEAYDGDVCPDPFGLLGS